MLFCLRGTLLREGLVLDCSSYLMKSCELSGDIALSLFAFNKVSQARSPSMLSCDRMFSLTEE